MRLFLNATFGAFAIGLFLAAFSLFPEPGPRHDLAGRAAIIVTLTEAPDIGRPLEVAPEPGHAAVLREAEADQLALARQVQAGRVIALKASQLQRQAVPRVTAHGGLALGWTV